MVRFHSIAQMNLGRRQVKVTAVSVKHWRISLIVGSIPTLPTMDDKCRKAGCNEKAVYPSHYPMTCSEHKDLGTGFARPDWMKYGNNDKPKKGA